MQKIYDVAVFGAGVVGCSIFNKICRCGKNAILLDKYDIASGESKANSAIIHAGFDAKPGTLKAKYNVLGSKLYPEICNRLGVPLKNIGAYVLSDNIEVPLELKNRGEINGLTPESLQVLNREQILKAIPNLSDNITHALFASTSSIVNPYLLTITLAEEGVINGGDYRLFFDTKKINYSNNIFEITDNNQTIKAKQIVNASGYGYNEIANLLNTENYDIKFRRGEYFVLDHSEANLVPATLFPAPTANSKGILVTPTVDGNILVGPTADDSDNVAKTTVQGLNIIKQRSNSLINNINLKKAIRVFSGIRTIVGDDFIVEKSKNNPNVINIAGICSPGLSSAPAIALDVLNLLNIENIEVNTKTITPYILSKDLNKQEFDELVKKDNRYGNVICKCEMIIEGDIVSCLHRPIKCITIDGVKRRVRAGMGRCQGGFCMDKVAKIIARENNIDEKDVIKEYPNSQLFVDDIKGGQA